MEELKRRSIVKAISWRVTGTLDTMVVSFIVTGSPTAALTIGVLELVTKTLLYYYHERVWNKIKYGRVKKEAEYQI